MWLETITLRTSAPVRTELQDTLAATVADAASNLGCPRTVVVFVRDESSTDLSIHVNHADRSPGAGSPFGLHLAENLRAHGIVDHAIWQSIDAQD